MIEMLPLKVYPFTLTLLHSEGPKLYRVLALLSAIGLNIDIVNSHTLVISKSKDPLKHFEISVCRHIIFAELRKIPSEQPNFTNEHVI